MSRTAQVTAFEQTNESSAFQQRYIVLYAQCGCNMNHFLHVYIDISPMYILSATMTL